VCSSPSSAAREREVGLDVWSSSRTRFRGRLGGDATGQRGRSVGGRGLWAQRASFCFRLHWHVIRRRSSQQERVDPPPLGRPLHPSRAAAAAARRLAASCSLRPACARPHGDSATHALRSQRPSAPPPGPLAPHGLTASTAFHALRSTHHARRRRRRRVLCPRRPPLEPLLVSNARRAPAVGDRAGPCVGPAVRTRTTTLSLTTTLTPATPSAPRGHTGGCWTAAPRGAGGRLARSHGRQGPAAVWLYVPRTTRAVTSTLADAA
jgi:hypothetical protein